MSATEPEVGDGAGRLAVLLGLALSGGGFRAAAFHLGVLKRLEELGLLRRIEALSTVSGGSITGGLYALRCGEQGCASRGYPVDQLIDEMVPFLMCNLRGRALFGSPVRAFRALLSLVSARVSRIGLIVDELDRQLFGRATLNQLPSWVVINATNLRTGKGWKFYSDRAGDYLAGATDHTSAIRVAEAVAASAAYPGLADSYPFATQWDHMRGDLLQEGRWERPPQQRPGFVSRWRERFGVVRGEVIFPLVDGGLYDNEGINSLRGRRVTHAIISGVAPPESDSRRGFGPLRYLRIVEVMHGRLGGATRQLAHEMSHGLHPAEAARIARTSAKRLRELADNASSDVAQNLRAIATEVESVAAVASPPRGAQFAASAQILLHRADLAENRYAETGLDIPEEYRGLSKVLVDELSRVRTDLDALEPQVIELLMSQGYFITDALVKLTMPDLIEGLAKEPYHREYQPRWSRAHAAVLEANANAATVASVLRAAATRCIPIGREPRRVVRWVCRANLVLASLIATMLAVTSGWVLHRLAHILVERF